MRILGINRFSFRKCSFAVDFALTGIDQLTGRVDELGDTLVATNRFLPGHDPSLQSDDFTARAVPDEHPITLVDAKESVYAQHRSLK